MVADEVGRGFCLEGLCPCCMEERKPINTEISLRSDTDMGQCDCTGMGESMVDGTIESSVTEDIGTFREIDCSTLAGEL